jgi:hypothetical protein
MLCTKVIAEVTNNDTGLAGLTFEFMLLEFFSDTLKLILGSRNKHNVETLFCEVMCLGHSDTFSTTGADSP